MPINPGQKETEEEFIGRCMSEETANYESDQAYAICKSKWDSEHMSKLSSPYDRVNAKFNSIRIKNKLIQQFAEEACPPETQDIALNLKNRQHAIEVAHYGPQNPNEPNDEYWKAKAEQFHSGDIEAAKKSLCGNCAFFDKTQKILDCIASGIGGEDAWDTIDAGDIALCTAFDFKCAAKRTCDAWVVGGPITD